MSAPPTVHSPRSPSGYHRWAHCLDAAHAEAGYPDQTSRWAAEGTLFHTIVAKLLTVSPQTGLTAHDYQGEERTIDGHDVVCDDDMVRHLIDGFDYISDLPGKLFVEQRVKLDRWMPGEFGTTDNGLVVLYDEPALYCSTCNEAAYVNGAKGNGWTCDNGHSASDCRVSTGRITIVDWKYGSEPVAAERNEQLMLYALGFWNWLVNRYSKYDGITDFTLVIRQPRVENGNSEWSLTLEELLAFGDEAAAAHKQSLKTGNPRAPGKKTCRWCKAKQSCKAYNDFVLDIIGAKLEDMQDNVEHNEYAFEPKPAKYLTPEQRAHILTNWPMVKAWHKSLEIDALNDGLKGRPTPGQKVIVGRRGQRRWQDEEIAMLRLRKLLGDDAMVEKIITPTEAEKKLTREEYKQIAVDLIVQDEGKPVLVEESEKGVPYVNYDDKLQQMAIEVGGEE